MTDINELTIVKSVLKEICQQCLLKGIIVSDSLAAYVVKAVILYPDNFFNVNQIVTKDEVNNLIQVCVDKLISESSPSLDTIKMQISFDEIYVDRDTFKSYYKKRIENKVLGIIGSLLETKPDTCKERECIFYKILAYVILRSDLGSLESESVMIETAAAIKSIYTSADLENFFHLCRSEKERHLKELTMITTGIRLYNKECERGGQEIEDLPNQLSDKVADLFSNVDIQLNITETNLDHMLTCLDYYRTTQKDLPSKLDEDLKQSVINCCQYLFFLKIIKKETIKTSKSIKANVEHLFLRLAHIHVTVANRLAIPNAQVFPQFACLSEIWKNIQREHSYVNLLNKLVNSIEEFIKSRRSILESEVYKKYYQLMEEDSLAKYKILPEVGPRDKMIEQTDKQDMLVLYPDTTSNYARLTLQFRGYCCWTMVMRDRLLVQGNLDIGIVCYNGLCYSFTSNHAAQDFISDPEWYINFVGSAAKQNLELVQLLQLYHLFSSLEPLTQHDNPAELLSAEMPLLKSDFSSQTDSLLPETNIDRSYDWNEWQMRRMAISLANLRMKKTHSTQTKMSGMRRDISTQVYVGKSTWTQTKIDARSNVPRPQVFLAGLRGTNPIQYRKVDLTLRDDDDE